jgi:hypothetical protein
MGGADCAIGGGEGCASGVGDTMVAPGDPITPEGGDAGAADCGATRLCTCAETGAGMIAMAPATAKTAAAAQRLKPGNPHPDIAFFLVSNHGNFMPRRTGQAEAKGRQAPHPADFPLLSPYPELPLVAVARPVEHLRVRVQ